MESKQGREEAWKARRNGRTLGAEAGRAGVQGDRGRGGQGAREQGSQGAREPRTLTFCPLHVKSWGVALTLIGGAHPSVTLIHLCRSSICAAHPSIAHPSKPVIIYAPASSI